MKMIFIRGGDDCSYRDGVGMNIFEFNITINKQFVI